MYFIFLVIICIYLFICSFIYIHSKNGYVVFIESISYTKRINLYFLYVPHSVEKLSN